MPPFVVPLPGAGSPAGRGGDRRQIDKFSPGPPTPRARQLICIKDRRGDRGQNGDSGQNVADAPERADGCRGLLRRRPTGSDGTTETQVTKPSSGGRMGRGPSARGTIGAAMAAVVLALAAMTASAAAAALSAADQQCLALPRHAGAREAAGGRRNALAAHRRRQLRAIGPRRARLHRLPCRHQPGQPSAGGEPDRQPAQRSPSP